MVETLKTMGCLQLCLPSINNWRRISQPSTVFSIIFAGQPSFFFGWLSHSSPLCHLCLSQCHGFHRLGTTGSYESRDRRGNAYEVVGGVAVRVDGSMAGEVFGLRQVSVRFSTLGYWVP